MLRSCVAGLVAATAYAVVSFLVLWLVGSAFRFRPGWEWVYAIAQLVLPLAASIWVARRIVRMPRESTEASAGARHRLRLTRIIITAGYVVTGAAGGPSVHTSQVTWVATEFTRIHGAPCDPTGRLPRTDVYLVFPILPGVLLSYYQYTINGLNGLEAWGVFVWHGTGAVKVLDIPLSGA